MSKIFTLDSLREETENKFAPVKVALGDGTEVILRGLIRLGQEDRENVVDNLKSIELISGDSVDDITEEDASVVLDSLTEVIRIIAGPGGDRLIEALDNDLALTLTVLESWLEESQLGEAKPSPAS